MTLQHTANGILLTLEPTPLPDELLDAIRKRWYIEDDDEGTMLLVEPTYDESTVIDPNNFAAVNTEVVEEKIETEVSQEKTPCCPICNKVIKSGNLFCGHCGHKLSLESERSVICPNCGFNMKPGVKFCGKCGFRF